MVFISMYAGQILLRISFLAVIASLSVGCLSRKTDQAIGAPAENPPPAAYPESNPAYADRTTAQPAAAPYQREAVAQREPEPFELQVDEQLVEHRIESGETLTSIAAKYSSRISRIQAANGMTDTTIYAGKSLKVPVKKETSVASASVPTAPSPPSAAPGVGAGSYSAGRFGAAPAAPSQSTYQGPAGASYASNHSASGSIAPPATTPVTAPDPASTSYPRVTTPAVSPAPPQPEEAFPTPSFGGFR